MYDDKLFNSLLFEKLRNRYISSEKFSDKISIEQIDLPDRFIEKYPETESKKTFFSELAEKSVSADELGIAIVNGGMATRFGGVVKGIVEVYDNKSFLQLKIENAFYIAEKYGSYPYIFIMNSISTHDATVEHFENNNYFGYRKDRIIFFKQYVFKRIYPNGEFIEDKDNLLYGCGHGDFYYAYKEFVYPLIKNKGIKYLYYSNVDNLGAYFDPAILGFHINSKKMITVEIAEKYKGDKGGAPAVINGKPRLVEEFMFPKNFNQDSIKFFNTATYIFSIEVFDKEIELPFYVVEKKIDDKTVIQFERLAGDLTAFADTAYIVVDRKKRFFPVKTREDLQNQKDIIKKILCQKQQLLCQKQQ